MADVTYDKVGKSFGSVEALRDFSLEIADREFMVLVGPSGSGKTTALRVLAGLEAHSSGHVYIGETLVDKRAPRDRDIAMVFQDYGLYPQMTVFDNLAFGLRTRKVPRREIDSRVRATAATLGLEELLSRKPRELSGGQRQRVALGRALVRDPKVFLMDEPLSNLDAKLRVEMRGEIKRLQVQTGTTTVYVTHDQVEAMTMGDRIAVINEGLLEQVGNPYVLYHEPVNTFVAGFIGSPAMTFGRYSVHREHERTRLVSGQVQLELEGDRELPSEVIVGVRPENTRLWGEGGDLVGPFTGRVEFLEALGRETLVGVVSDSDLRFIVQADGQFNPAIDELVRFGIERRKLHLFDPVDGRSLSARVGAVA